jgi:hypothetical protein
VKDGKTLPLFPGRRQAAANRVKLPLPRIGGNDGNVDALVPRQRTIA